jgi:hypothetical protein
MVVLDARGVIRVRDPADLDPVVDALVAEAKSGSNR